MAGGEFLLDHPCPGAAPAGVNPALLPSPFAQAGSAALHHHRAQRKVRVNPDKLTKRYNNEMVLPKKSKNLQDLFQKEMLTARQ